LTGRVAGREARSEAARLQVSLCDSLNRQRDLHFVADEEAARFEGRVPIEAEILAIHRRFGFEADALAAPWVRRVAEERHRQVDLLARAAHRQVANDVEGFGAGLLDRLALERQRRGL